MKRIIASLLAVLVTAPTFIAPTLASAQSVTGPWVWTDISNQLTTRTNRPVWSVAYGNGNWFYTDGLDLWNSGQVYRYDGSTQTNITADIRNAGVTRVDDIVSDGNTILFLQDIVRMDNQFSLVAYRNGQYLNLTAQVRGALQSDEGVSSIQGRAGTWYVVTNKARLFRLNEVGVATEITLPSGIAGNIEGDRGTMRYNVNHGSMVRGAGRVPLAIVPVANGNWLLMADTWNSMPRFFRYNGSSFTEVTTLFPASNGNINDVFMSANFTRVLKIVSNGENALVISDSYDSLTNGTTRTDIGGLPVNGGFGSSEVRTGWNGKSWLVFIDKNLYRVSNTLSTQTAQSMGVVRDLFLQGAGDNNGRFLLGGAQSELGINDPTSPLTAKLVMVTEGVAAPQVLGTTTSVGGPTVNVQGNPSDFRVGNGREFSYRVNATDPEGVNRIDIYVNGALIRTCLLEASCEYRTTYWTNGATTRNVSFFARATDSHGNVTQGPTNTLTVDINSGAGANGQVLGTTDTTNTNVNTNGSVWTWFAPNQTTLFANQSVNFHVGAQDNDGLDRIEIVADGSTVRTCTLGNSTGNRECDWTLYANNYNQGASIFVNAKAVDRFGNDVWSNGTTFFRANDGVLNPPVQTLQAPGPSVQEWIEPSDETLKHTSDFTDYHMRAWDDSGLNRIEIWVNGTMRRTCDFNNALGNQECTWRIHASDYTSGSDVFVNAKAVDRFGNETWGNGKTIRIRTNNNPPQTGNQKNPAVWDWLEPNDETLERTSDATDYRMGAWDEDGLDRIDIWVNGTVRRTCDFNNALGNQECTWRIHASDYTSGSDVFVNAKAVDRFGNATWTNGKTVRIRTGNTGTNPNPSQGTLSVSASKNTYTSGDHIQFTATASTNASVDHIDLYMNDIKIKRCYGTRTCTITVGPFYTNTTVRYNAVLTETNGNTVTSGYGTVTRP